MEFETGNVKVKAEDLNESEKGIVNKEVSYNEPKISREVDISKIELKIKKYHQEGNSQEYSLNLAVYIGNRKFDADHSDWELGPAIKKVFDKMLQELEHEFHLSDDH